MARVLCYTSPGRGHLYPTVPVLLELARRGHDVALATLAVEVDRMNALGLRARAPESRHRARPARYPCSPHRPASA
jgi:UDP:flavonoid glycosyltransferase YjiC (YdhE family)